MKRFFVWTAQGVASLLAVSSMFEAGVAAGRVSANPFLGFGLAMLGLAVAFYVSMVFHELGHAFFGMLTGYDVVALGIGRFALVKDEGDWRLTRTVLQPGVAAQYVGVKRDEADARFFWMLAGGLVAHLILMAIAAVAGIASGHWQAAYPVIALNAALFVVNAIPVGVTDAAKILELKRYPSHISLLYLSMRHNVATYLVPEEQRLANFVTSVPSEPGFIAQVLRLNAIEVLVMTGALETAEQELAALLENAEETFIRPAAQATRLHLALLQGRNDEAATIASDKSVMSLLTLKMTNVQAVRALYEVRVNKDTVAAKKALQKAQQALTTSRFLQDEKEYYEALMQQVSDEIAAM